MANVQALQIQIPRYTPSDEVIEFQRRAAELSQSVTRMNFQLAEQIQATHSLIEPLLPHIRKYLLAYDIVTKNIIRSLAPTLMQFSIVAKEIISKIDPKIFEYLHIWNSLKNVSLRQVFETLRANYPDSIEDEESVNRDIAILTDAEKNELVQITEVVVTQSANWQARLVEWCDKWAECNPALVRLLKIVIMPLFLTVAGAVIATAVITARQTPLREEPATNAATITNIIHNQNIFIINSVPYWYEIEYEDTSTGKYHCGWIPKRTAKQDDSPVY